ncbi:MAG TPA: UbiA family prenyltransferase, partial [Cytophagaceae bacterium]|nr:UbiA family prenyltransferase [Cytophagaceae bacterium]
MIKKSTILHLRIPFSLYLLPFFCFAASQATHPNLWYLLLSAIIIHLIFYPSANAFNSYYDKDEGSIGGLENPPPVDKEVLYVSYIFEFASLVLAFLIGWRFAVMILIINLMFKAYSHPWIRLKKYPWIGLLTVAIFQGGHTYMMSYMAINDASFDLLLESSVIIPAMLCTVLLLGSYPMTQIYQHEEDGRRGDLTISRRLGVRGTFIWTGIIYALGISGFVAYLTSYYSFLISMALLICLSPTLIYFIKWFLR